MLLAVEAQCHGGRIPESRSREHRHESLTHLHRWWRLVVALLRHNKTKSLYIYFAINCDFFNFFFQLLLLLLLDGYPLRGNHQCVWFVWNIGSIIIFVAAAALHHWREPAQVPGPRHPALQRHHLRPVPGHRAPAPRLLGVPRCVGGGLRPA